MVRSSIGLTCIIIYLNKLLIFAFNFFLEIVKKTLRVVLKTKYDVETISQKQDQLETVVKNSSFHQKINSQNDYNSQQEVSFEMLPITSEDDLTAFEEKLSSDKTFKSNLVCFINII